MSNIKLHQHSALPHNIHINVVRNVQRITSKKDFVILREDVLPFSRFEVQDIVYKERGSKRKREDKEEDCLDTPEGSESSSTRERQQPTPVLVVAVDKKLGGDDENSLWDALELELLFGEKKTQSDTTCPRSIWVSEDDDDDNHTERVCAAQ